METHCVSDDKCIMCRGTFLLEIRAELRSNGRKRAKHKC